MTKTVSYLLAMALATSAWTIKAEATGKGNPTGGKFAVEHPRRNEVNTRIDNQRERINQGVKNGTLTQQQAQQLRANDRAIKQQEHAERQSQRRTPDARGAEATKPGRECQQHANSRREASAVAIAAQGAGLLSVSFPVLLDCQSLTP